jgi:hypothetical protein
MTSDSTVVPLRQPDAVDDPLTAVPGAALPLPRALTLVQEGPAGAPCQWPRQTNAGRPRAPFSGGREGLTARPAQLIFHPAVVLHQFTTVFRCRPPR